VDKYQDGSKVDGVLGGNVTPLEGLRGLLSHVAALRGARFKSEAASDCRSPLAAATSRASRLFFRLLPSLTGVKPMKLGAQPERSRAEGLPMRVPAGRFADLRDIAAAAVLRPSNGGKSMDAGDLLIDGGRIVI
jgi:hypothetical protein